MRLLTAHCVPQRRIFDLSMLHHTGPHPPRSGKIILRGYEGDLVGLRKKVGGWWELEVGKMDAVLAVVFRSWSSSKSCDNSLKELLKDYR